MPPTDKRPASRARVGLRAAPDLRILMKPTFSYWEHQTFFGPADVVVIGGGLVGLTTAIYTKERRPAWRVTVLERWLLPTGASTKNAGFACFGSVSELLEQEQRGNLLAVVEARWEGLRRLRELVGDAPMRYEPVGNYEIFRAEEAELARDCLAQLAHYNALLAPAIGTNRIYHDATHRAPEFGFRGVQAIIANAHEGALDTGRMVAALLARAAAAGVLVLYGCGADWLETASDGTTAIGTSAGPAIRAGRVVVATNAFAPELLPELDDVTPGRGQVLVTAPIAGLKPWPGPIHYDHGYTYARVLPDAAGPRILLGGGRHLDFGAEATTTPGLTDSVQHYLENLLRTVLLPNHPAPPIDYRWSGVMAFGPALEPIVRWVRPGVLAAVRCNGMGVAMGAGTGWRAAELVAAG